MNMLNELTIKNLKQNKKRTIMTIIGIMLSVALITAITTFVSSMQRSMVDYAKQQNGDYHVLVSDVPEEKQKYLLQHVNIERVMEGKTLGEIAPEEFLPAEICKDQEGMLKLRAFEEKALSNIGIFLIDGKLPKNDQEILIPNVLSGIDGKNYVPGDEIRIRVNQEEKTYRVAGVMGRNSFEFKKNESMGYTFVTKLSSEQAGEKDYLLTLKKPTEVYTFCEELVEKSGFSEEQLLTNDGVLRFEGSSKSEHTMAVLRRISMLVIGIILFTSVFVIKNSFDISITERIRQYGMLTSVGATSKQIRKNVFFEGVVLGGIGVPLGILSGIFAIWLTLEVVKKILLQSSLSDIPLGMHLSWKAILAAIVIAVIIIYLSALMPARKAVKISPMDAIRGTGKQKLNGKKLRTAKWFGKLFGVEGELASKSLKRSKKKYRTTVFSIFLSVVMFVSIGSILQYGFLLQSYVYHDMGYNLEMDVQSPELEEEVLERIYAEALNTKGIQKGTIIKSAVYFIQDAEYSKETLKYELPTYESKRAMEENINVVFYSVSEEMYRSYVKELGLSYESAKDQVIICDTQRRNLYDQDSGKTTRRQFPLLASGKGDVLSYRTIMEQEEKIASISIAKKTEKMPFGVLPSYYDVIAIVSEETMARLDSHLVGIYMDAENPGQVKKEIRQMDSSLKWDDTDYEELKKENKSMVLILSIFLYGFIAVISLIGITNIFNTITTNMALRSREFAILRSVGMTEKEFRKMIRYESLLYGAKALLFGIPVGVGLSYVMYRMFIGVIEVSYELPWNEMGIACVAVFLIVFWTMQYSVKKAEKQNMIETLRNENI